MAGKGKRRVFVSERINQESAAHAEAMAARNPDWLKAKPMVKLITCITVALEDGLVQDVTLLPLKVEVPKLSESATIRVEIRNYDVYDSGDGAVCDDEQGREYYQTLYFF